MVIDAHEFLLESLWAIRPRGLADKFLSTRKEVRRGTYNALDGVSELFIRIYG
jgi:hypothetical protein